MNWTVRLSGEAAAQFRQLPRDRQELIRKHLRGMREDPFRGNVKPLKGKKWKGRYRKAVGRYRLIFISFHSERVVEVSAILRRTEKIYR
jgi:mRNA-degrading endonuclease RelE of RelBE toxin-antitoxin system